MAGLRHLERALILECGGLTPPWFVAACRHGVEGDRVVLYTARQASPFKARASSAHSKKHRQLTGGRGCAEPPAEDRIHTQPIIKIANQKSKAATQQIADECGKHFVRKRTAISRHLRPQSNPRVHKYTLGLLCGRIQASLREVAQSCDPFPKPLRGRQNASRNRRLSP